MGYVEGTHVDLGHALVTMIEPTHDPHDLAEYNRWYEHDHAYSGVMSGPGAFSFGRFVATRPLKDLRFPAASTVADPLDNGSFIAIYFILAGSVDEHFAWSFGAMPTLTEQGRMNPNRAHVFTSCTDFAGSVNRGDNPVPAHVALDHSYPGLAMVWHDRAGDATADELDRWLRESYYPKILDGSPIAQVLTFAPRDFPTMPGSGVGVGEKVVSACFLDCDPRDAWDEHVRPMEDAVAASGLGTVGLAAAFIPVEAGTNRYLDELW